MKILVLSQYWHPENGVPQRRWSWLAGILTEAGHDVTVIAPPPHYKRQLTFGQWLSEVQGRSFSTSESGASGEKIFRSAFVPGGPSILQKTLNQAVVAAGTLVTGLVRPGALKDYRPDVVIGTVPALPTAPVCWAVAKRMNAPFIIDLRDAWPDLLQVSDTWNRGLEEPGTQRRQVKKLAMTVLKAAAKTVVNASLRHSDALMVTSGNLRKSYRRRLPDIPAVTIRNVFPPQSSSSRAPRRGEDGRLHVLYAGTLGRAQHLNNALEAARLAEEQGTSMSLKFVGAGVSRKSLVRLAERYGLDAEFYQQHAASDLSEFYEWADTALVHLTDWEPLERTVPSKTYELMENCIHISGVVVGETADLVNNHKAGDVVPPEDPAALAALWVELSRHRERLIVSDSGAQWVRDQREHEVPRALLELIARVGNA